MIKGCLEMATQDDGYIKHFNSRLKDGTLHVGWVDAKTGNPVDDSDKDVRGKYEKAIMGHVGMCFFGELLLVLAPHVWCRLSESELFGGYDLIHKVFNSEVELIHDLEPLEVTDTGATGGGLAKMTEVDILD
jgi:fatty acid synthase subunit alpha, fungi type